MREYLWMQSKGGVMNNPPTIEDRWQWFVDSAPPEILNMQTYGVFGGAGPNGMCPFRKEFDEPMPIKEAFFFCTNKFSPKGMRLRIGSDKWVVIVLSVFKKIEEAHY